MVRRPALSLHTLLVSAVVTLAISPSSAFAQGVQSWHALEASPDTPEGKSFVNSVRFAPAYTIDPTLPAMTFDEWLSLTLIPVVEVVGSPLVEWELRRCFDDSGAIPNVGPELCVEGTASVSAERTLRVVVTVAETVRDAATKRLAWRPLGPSLRDVHLERLKGSSPVDSLDVPSLGALAEMLGTPFEQWPSVNFETTVAWFPQKPSPGAPVRFSISVRNTGRRDAHRAHVEILIVPCCTNTEVRRHWYPRIAAGESVSAEVTVVLPQGMADMIVIATPWHVPKPMREPDPNQQPTYVYVGYPYVRLSPPRD
jgi:hypothetical protein